MLINFLILTRTYHSVLVSPSFGKKIPYLKYPMMFINVFVAHITNFYVLPTRTTKKSEVYTYLSLRYAYTQVIYSACCPIYILDSWESILKNLNFLNYLLGFIKAKFFLLLGLGPFFPYFFVISFVFVGSLIMCIHVFRKSCPNFVLSKNYQAILVIPIVFTMSIPLLGFAFFFRSFLKSQYGTKINTLLGGGGFLGSVTAKGNTPNDYLDSSEHLRMTKIGSAFNSKGELPRSFSEFVTRKTFLDFNKDDKWALFSALDAGKQLASDRFNMLPFILKAFPDGYIEQGIFIKKGIPIYVPEKRELVYSKVGTVVKKDEFLELLKPSFFELVSTANLSKEMIYQAMLDAQMQKHVLKHKEEYQIGKYLNTLGDNLTELEVLIRLMKQQDMFVDMMSYYKPDNNLIDLQNKYNLQECYQIKNQTFGNSKFNLKYNLDNQNTLNKFCKDIVYSKIGKYIEANNDVKLLFNLEAATVEHASKIAFEIHRQYPNLSDRILFANPKEYPVCSTEEKTAIVNMMKGLMKHVYTYYT